ncbi:MAG: hypothetical protein U1A27_09130 [Phycisphaerae bacterium]
MKFGHVAGGAGLGDGGPRGGVATRGLDFDALEGGGDRSQLAVARFKVADLLFAARELGLVAIDDLVECVGIDADLLNDISAGGRSDGRCAPGSG